MVNTILRFFMAVIWAGAVPFPNSAFADQAEVKFGDKTILVEDKMISLGAEQFGSITLWEEAIKLDLCDSLGMIEANQVLLKRIVSDPTSNYGSALTTLAPLHRLAIELVLVLTNPNYKISAYQFVNRVRYCGGVSKKTKGNLANLVSSLTEVGFDDEKLMSLNKKLSDDAVKMSVPIQALGYSAVWIVASVLSYVFELDKLGKVFLGSTAVGILSALLVPILNGSLDTLQGLVENHASGDGGVVRSLDRLAEECRNVLVEKMVTQ